MTDFDVREPCECAGVGVLEDGDILRCQWCGRRRFQVVDKRLRVVHPRNVTPTLEEEPPVGT